MQQVDLHVHAPIKNEAHENIYRIARSFGEVFNLAI